MELSDLEWGDVVSDKDGVLVVRATHEGLPVVVKRYGRPEHTREIRHYALLMALGVPTLEVLGTGEDWLALADIASSEFRLADELDLGDPDAAVLLARWYDQLHAAGMGITGLADLHDELAVLDDDGLTEVARRWPELAPGVEAVRGELSTWLATAAEFPRTLVHNDFFAGNMAIARDWSSALMFDHNLLGAGYRYADVRNVMSGLEGLAPQAFRAEYERLQAERGTPLDTREAEIDEPLSHLAALVLATARGTLPAWAQDSADWLRRQA